MSNISYFNIGKQNHFFSNTLIENIIHYITKSMYKVSFLFVSYVRNYHTKSWRLQ